MEKNLPFLVRSRHGLTEVEVQAFESLGGALSVAASKVKEAAMEREFLVISVVEPRNHLLFLHADIQAGPTNLRLCRVCGCSEFDPCEIDLLGEACAWAEYDLCSACVGKEAPSASA